jgi:hypothetical protein
VFGFGVFHRLEESFARDTKLLARDVQSLVDFGAIGFDQRLTRSLVRELRHVPPGNAAVEALFEDSLQASNRNERISGACIPDCASDFLFNGGKMRIFLM